MTKNNKSSILLCLGIMIAGLMYLPSLTSCGKTGVNASTANAQINLINVSPDVRPFNLYSRQNNNYVLFNTTNYSYPNASGYFLLNTVDSPFLIRSASINNVDVTNLLPIQGGFKPNVRYTWFVTGLRSDSSLTSLIIPDTGALPKIGRGKVRFVNVSPNAPLLNLTLNDTTAFTRLPYKGVSKFIEVTAGNYNIKVAASSAPAVSLKTLNNVTILDGNLYTIYTYGLTGRADTAAFSSNVILNTVPLKYN